MTMTNFALDTNILIYSLATGYKYLTILLLLLPLLPDAKSFTPKTCSTI